MSLDSSILTKSAAQSCAQPLVASNKTSSRIIAPLHAQPRIYGVLLKKFLLGVLRGASLHNVVKAASKSPELRRDLLHCVVLNGVIFIGSMLFYTYFVHTVSCWPTFGLFRG